MFSWFKIPLKLLTFFVSYMLFSFFWCYHFVQLSIQLIYFLISSDRTLNTAYFWSIKKIPA